MEKLNYTKYAFIILLIIHGLIHLMGFIKAFWVTDASMQVLGISKPIGAIWLVVFILFVITASQFFNNKNWFYVAFLAVLVSQILIVLAWKGTKYGTILNFVILLIGLSGYANFRFKKKIQKESLEILGKENALVLELISENDINHLPQIVQKWLRDSGVIGSQRIFNARLKQKGEMRTKPNAKWMPFKATQYFNIQNPSFVWSAIVDAMPIIKMVGRDKFIDGKGEMLIKLEALIPVVNEAENDKVNSGTMIRFLSEMCWFPSAALNNYMSWESIDDNSAKATFTYKNQSISGVFLFTDKGQLVSFETQRYYGGNEKAMLEKWLVEIMAFKEFNSIKIPNLSKVTWRLKEGDFHWLSVEILDIEYNVIDLY